MLKLVAKQRQGAKVLKRYDRAQTPYQRLLASGVVAEAAQLQRLADMYGATGPEALRQQLDATVAQLCRLEERSQSVSAASAADLNLSDQRR